MERWAYEYFRRCEIEERCRQEAEWLLDHPKDGVRKILESFVSVNHRYTGIYMSLSI